MRFAGRLAASASILALAVAAPAGAQQRSDPAADAAPGEYLVGFDPGTDKRKAVKDHGGRIKGSIPALDVHHVEFDDKKRDKGKELKKDKRFRSVEPNYIYRATYTPDDPGFTQQWAWTRIQAPAAWDVTLGSDVTSIAVIDTGVQRSHPDLDAKIRPGYDWVQGDTAPDDGHGHGTHVAGSAAAETGNATGGSGTCPGCSVMPLRVLDNQGSGTLANVASAITYAADRGAKVINLSLGGSGTSTLQNAVDYASSKGVFLACAAGNDSTSSTTYSYPAAYANCFAVASTTGSDVRSSFSNYGTWVAVAAPGSSIYSTWLRSGYNTVSGTSMAAPHVAGLAGLLASRGLTAAQIRERICSTAAQISGTGSLWTCGRIDAAAAVGDSTDSPPPPPPGETDAIVNGGFESGLSPWTQTSSGGYNLVDSSRPHSGSHSVWMGGYNYATESVSQAITVPANGTLRYWWYMGTAESGSTVYDRLRVRVLSASGAVLGTLRTWSNASGAGVWREDTLSIGSWAGQSIRVEFLTTTDSTLPTSFYVDDVSAR